MRVNLRRHAWWRLQRLCALKRVRLCKYQPDKKYSCRQDFWPFGRLGQPTEAQSTVIYCLFGCNWWKQGHNRCDATGNFHPRSWWHFDRHRGVCGVGANDGYDNSSWYFHRPSQSTGQSRSERVPQCQLSAWLRMVCHQWLWKKRLLWKISERKCRLQMADVIFGLQKSLYFASGSVVLQGIKDG